VRHGTSLKTHKNNFKFVVTSRLKEKAQRKRNTVNICFVAYLGDGGAGREEAAKVEARNQFRRMRN